MKPAPSSPLRATRLLDQVRERLRYGHYSLSTERSYVYWVRWFVRFGSGRDGRRLTSAARVLACAATARRLLSWAAPPRDMGAAEVEGFLSWLANRRGVSASIHRQALAALIFLYKQVLEVDLPWLQEIGRPRTPQRLPVVVMSRAEVQQLLAASSWCFGFCTAPECGKWRPCDCG